MAEGDLLIGLGNTQRGDDGVADHLADWARRRWPGLRVRCVQQLTPELSCELATAGRVLFLDAWQGPSAGSMPDAMDPHGAGIAVGTTAAEGPERQADGGGAPPRLSLRVIPAAGAALPETGAFSHRLDPDQLLAITGLLHGRVPPAWLMLVPGFRFCHGEGLSAGVRALLPRAQALLRRWCEGEGGEPAAAPGTDPAASPTSRRA